MMTVTDHGGQGKRRAAWRLWAARLGLAAMLLHLAVAAFHHHTALPELGLSLGHASATAVSGPDQAPLDDGSDCAICQILSVMGWVPDAAQSMAAMVTILGLVSFVLFDRVFRRPPVVAGYPRAPPVSL